MNTGIYNLGVGGLAAAQAGLVATGHNIANASSAGYRRQSIEQAALPALATGSGFMGQGVQVTSVVRAYSQSLETQLSQAQSQASYFSTYQAQMAQIDNVVADATAGLSPALQAFFASTQTVASNPADVASRQSLLSAGSTLTARFNALASRFDELQSGVNTQISATVKNVNTLTQQVATLNDRILAQQRNPQQQPNDLLDQRDALISQLNKLTGATSVQQSDGSINVVVGSGQSLVVGHQAIPLGALQSPEDPRQTVVGYSISGNSVPLGDNAFQGGSLGALLAFRTNDLNTAQNALGQVAVGLTQTFNDQHQLGQDLNGVAGVNFFKPLTPDVIARSTNSGSAVVSASVSDATALTASDYRLSYTGTGYTVTRLADNTVTAYASLPQTIDGLTISLASGAAASGDSFLIEPTRSAARNMAMNITNGAQIAAAAPMRAAAANANTGSGTISAGTVDAPPPQNANIRQPVTLTFTAAGTFSVSGTGTGNPVGVAYTAGSDISYNGWTVQIAGTPAVGDVFTIGPNSGGVADGRNALLLGGLQTQNMLSSGTASYQGVYSQMVSQVGSKMQQVNVMVETQNTLAQQATVAQQSVSGVNLDEEAANLLRYQQAYQAAGKMIQIAQSLFQSILQIQ
jgi:flagellar hook-associated protein 1 FlgK